MAVKPPNSGNYPSVSWADTLDLQRSALRWDVKRAMKSLCSKLEEIGEECFVVTVNVSNGWVGHLGTLRGDEYIDDKSHILYDFLSYCGESLFADESREGTEDNGSDAESDKDNSKVDAEPDNDMPIKISRPGAKIEDNRSDTNDYVIVETPTQYTYKKPKEDLTPMETHPQKFILLSPADIQNVTHKVLETEYRPIKMKTTLLEPQSNECSQDKVIADNSTKGGKRKRKQTFDSIGKQSSKEPCKDLWSVAPASSPEKSKRYHKNKRHRDEIEDKSMPYVSNLNATDEASTVKFVPGCGLVDSEEVTASTRVLRSKSLQGKKQDNTSPLQKIKVKDTSKSSGDEEEDDTNLDDVDDDDEDFDVDDANDEDWDLEIEFGKTNERDNMGRFLRHSHTHRKKTGRKRNRTEDDLEIRIETEEYVHESDGNSRDNSDSISVQIVHTIGADGSLEIENITAEVGNESKTGQRKQNASETESCKELESHVDSDLEGGEGEVCANKGETEEKSTDESEKEKARRPSLKRKLRNVANEKWAVVDDLKSDSDTK